MHLKFPDITNQAGRKIADDAKRGERKKINNDG